MTGPQPASAAETDAAIRATLRRLAIQLAAAAREAWEAAEGDYPAGGAPPPEFLAAFTSPSDRAAAGHAWPHAYRAGVLAERECVAMLADEREAGYLSRRVGTGALRYERFADLIRGRGSD